MNPHLPCVGELTSALKSPDLTEMDIRTHVKELNLPWGLESEVRSGGLEKQPDVQGAAAAWAQECREELLHVQGQEGWP